MHNLVDKRIDGLGGQRLFALASAPRLARTAAPPAFRVEKAAAEQVRRERGVKRHRLRAGTAIARKRLPNLAAILLRNPNGNKPAKRPQHKRVVADFRLALRLRAQLVVEQQLVLHGRGNRGGLFALLRRERRVGKQRVKLLLDDLGKRLRVVRVHIALRARQERFA